MDIAGSDRTEPLRHPSQAERLARRLDTPMGALGLVFLLVVLGQSLAEDRRLVTALTVAGWLLWLVFVAEFALRAYVARDQRRFWASNWWQLVFLAVPFLRFARAFTLLRAARVGSTVTGEPLSAAGGVARVLEVVLAVYSVAVFATLAGAIGAFFLQTRDAPPG